MAWLTPRVRAPAARSRLSFSWRARGQLDQLMSDARRFKDDDGAVLRLLDRATVELARAREFIAGRAIDQKPYKDLIKRPQKKDGAAAHAIQLASRL